MTVEVDESVTTDETFDAFFAEAVGGGETAEKPVEEKPVEEKPVEVSEKPVEEKPVEEKPVVIEPEKKAEPVNIQNIVAETLAAADAERKKQEPAKEEKPDPEAEAREKKFKEDWPDHATYFDQMKLETKALKDELAKTKDELAKQIQPVVSQAEANAATAHEQAILAEHKEAFDTTFQDGLIKWFDSLTPFVKATYGRALTEGTAKDVNAILGEYKKSLPEAKVEEKKSEVKIDEKVRHLEPVNSRRSASTEALDPNDFQSAFEQAVKTASK